MTEEEFNKLIEKYQRGTASREEAEMVEYWLEMRAAENPYEAIPEKEKTAIQQRILDHIKSGMTGKEEFSSPSGRIIPRLRLRIAAAVFLLIAGVGVWRISTINTQPEWLTVTTSATEGVVEKVILADGSIIWLRENSELIFPADFSGAERKVELKGEALFEIMKDTLRPEWWAGLLGRKSVHRPFVVQSGEVQTKVMGTSFQIMHRNDATEVFVLTGKVELSSPGMTGLALLPNEKAVYRGSGKAPAKTESEPAQLDIIRNRPGYKEIVRGTEYDMFFENESMKTVLRRIGEKFDRTLRMDPAMRECLIRADLTDRSLQETLNLITETLDASYEIRDTLIYISGEGCE